MKREKRASGRQRLAARGSGSSVNRFGSRCSRIVFPEAIISRTLPAASHRFSNSSLQLILEISSDITARPSAARQSFDGNRRVFQEEVLSARTSF